MRRVSTLLSAIGGSRCRNDATKAASPMSTTSTSATTMPVIIRTIFRVRDSAIDFLPYVCVISRDFSGLIVRVEGGKGLGKMEQKAESRRQKAENTTLRSLTFSFCLLLSAYCLLPTAF